MRSFMSSLDLLIATRKERDRMKAQEEGCPPAIDTTISTPPTVARNADRESA